VRALQSDILYLWSLDQKFFRFKLIEEQLRLPGGAIMPIGEVRRSNYIDYKTWNGRANLRARIHPGSSQWDIFDFQDKLKDGGPFNTIEYMIANYEPWYASWRGDKLHIANGAGGDPKDVSAFRYVGWEINPPELWEVSWDGKTKEFVHTHVPFK
jgi:hypothetical protein